MRELAGALRRRTAMRRLPTVLFATCLLLAGCGDDDASGASTTGPGSDSETTLPEDVVVFDSDDVETDVNGELTTWTPDAADIEAAEAALAEYIAANPDLGVDPIDGYVRQYVGISEDEDLVSANALCQSANLEDWEDEIILVNDGGPCFWQATVDPATGTIASFQVNGEA